jgi:release factor glutamine methyltransferase
MTAAPPPGEPAVAELLRHCGLAPAEARALMRAALNVDDAFLIAHPGHRPDTDQLERFRAAAARRRGGEPVAYLTGEREFYSLAFQVTPAVLIPRPETELLVDAALARLPEHARSRVLDLATGSGCVAIAIARHRPDARVTATDVSPEALAVARENAAAHQAQIEFLQSDWFQALAGRRFDLIVANPPYLALGDPHLVEGDVRFEPRQALVAGPDGLDGIEILVEQAPGYLAAQGSLLFEHGYDQGSCARVMLEAAGYEAILTLRDLAGHERVSGGLTPPRHRL